MTELFKNIYKCFKDGKHKVLSLSYDDGRTADRRLVEIFNRFDLKGTFHLNSSWFGMNDRIDASEVKELYKGHEVSVHTCTHPTTARSPISQVVQQVIEDRKNLESLVGYTVRGMSYPNGSFSDEIKSMLPHVGIEYARITGNSDEFSMPRDWYEWKSTCHHNHNLIENAKRFLELKKVQHIYMFYVWGHSYEFDNDNNWELMEEFAKLVSGNDDIWYATNMEIVDYLKAMDQLKYSASGDFVYNPTATDLWISVDGEILKVPAGKQTFTTTQNEVENV